MPDQQSIMRLLVSVSSPEEAAAALSGGADIVDAKNPLAGALGPVAEGVLRSIHAAVAGSRLVTAALGDIAHEADAERAARAFAAAGAALVKLGFSGISSPRRVADLTAAAVRGARSGGGETAGVVVVAYADAERVGSLAAGAFPEIAARAGATGVLLDTADKNGPGLRGLVFPRALEVWVTEAHDAGLLVALAGKLQAVDLPFVREAGADIAGVRGAACDNGRTGAISAERVALLRQLCGPAAAGEFPAGSAGRVKR